jgi:hypothetical protein
MGAGSTRDRAWWLLTITTSSLVGTAGCHRSHVFPVMLPNGGSAYAVECESIQRCQEEIFWTCEEGHGYQILEQSSAYGTEANAMATQNFGTYHYREGETRTITFLCQSESFNSEQPQLRPIRVVK